MDGIPEVFVEIRFHPYQGANVTPSVLIYTTQTIEAAHLNISSTMLGAEWNAAPIVSIPNDLPESDDDAISFSTFDRDPDSDLPLAEVAYSRDWLGWTGMIRRSDWISGAPISRILTGDPFDCQFCGGEITFELDILGQ